MNNKSFSFRPFNVGGCFEFKLPNGKTVLVDPYFPEDGKGVGKDKEAVKACDYILLSHTHFDHDMHVGHFVEKYNPKVFTQAPAAEDVMIFHNIPIDNIIPVHHGQTFELDGFTVQAFMTKHATFGMRRYDPNHDPTFNRTGIKGHKRVDMYGDIECVNYLITLSNGFTTAIISGTDFSKDIPKICTQHHVDILFRQFGIRSAEGVVGDSQIPPEEFAEVIAQYHAQVCIPFHFENALRKWGEEKMTNYLHTADEILRKKQLGSIIVKPEAWVWYNAGVEIAE